jgi:hypothetical protein
MRGAGAPAAPLLPVIIDLTRNTIGDDAHHHRAGAASLSGSRRNIIGRGAARIGKCFT